MPKSAKNTRESACKNIKKRKQGMRKINLRRYEKKDACIVATLSPQGQRVYSRLKNRIWAQVASDPELKALGMRLTELRKNTEAIEPPKQKVSAEDVWKSDMRMNRTASYYDSESTALAVDLDYVVASENRRVILEQIIQTIRKKEHEIAGKECPTFWPLLNLPAAEYQQILLSLGVLPEKDFPEKLPTDAVSSYRVVVHPRREEDDWEPSPEVMELLAEDAARGQEDPFQAMVAAGLVSPGKKVCITYGNSSGKGRA